MLTVKQLKEWLKGVLDDAEICIPSPENDGVWVSCNYVEVDYNCDIKLDEPDVSILLYH